MRTIRSRALAALVLPAALLLGACGLIPGGGGIPGVDLPDQVDEGIVEDILEGSTGGDVDFALDELPDGFPVDEVPIVQGRIVSGFTVPGSGSEPRDSWQLTIAVPDEATAKSAESLLEAAGYTNAVIAWDNGTYFVVVAPSEADGEWHVSYIVTEQ